MLHEPAAQGGKDYASGYKMKVGVLMFFLYAAVYGGFVAINVVKPVLMETRVVFGLNLAVVYGFGLIILALVLALVYNRLCAARERAMNPAEDGKEGV